MTDKRQFQRVSLNVNGTLAHNDVSIDVVVSDVSLQGIKLQATETALSHLPFDSHDPYTATFQANEDSPVITLSISQLYRHADSRKEWVSLGCKVERMDVDSISALRRLITLNSDDASIEEKDLNALVNAVYQAPH
ncbi:MAG: PilZ domain-containing protein [Alteromonas macleodii]|uniref:PilZ domain-containing protein n=1 Tax=Alteromonas TaxID=226 RepID=UPI0012752619|nr:PilZ domain-containing protein [Alteromonas macleodii]MDM7961349.1 PilZ domain-containing protein [Alteromonas macleodii]MDM8170106.1 PilZ domain-containing protein [Alteromonas macleodii]CAI3963272.1 PilZ domain-containing protein [Alteromonas macleodii]VTP56453.1 PilZ domain-containing protein [Alteromonas macleodii]